MANVYSPLKESLKDILPNLAEAELDASLGYKKNQKANFYTNKKYNGEFEPKLVSKCQQGTSDIEDKVISLYVRGRSTKDIHNQLQEFYGIGLSAKMISKITGRILSQAAYFILDVTPDGYKGILSIMVEANETSKF